MLSREDLGDDPLAAYAAWVRGARDAGVVDPDAAVLATVDEDGQPAARAVLVRVVDEAGVVFFTNASSRKGRHIAANPRVALTSVWTSLRRQVRIEGAAEPATAEESDAYWRNRPHGSRLAAIASPQSQPISRDELEDRWTVLARQHPEGSDIPRPPWWGGFRVRPHRVEFWQGREHRLHDRIAFERLGDGWRAVRLAP